MSTNDPWDGVSDFYKDDEPSEKNKAIAGRPADGVTSRPPRVLANGIRAYAARSDRWHITAALNLCADSQVILHKIEPYVGDDGSVDFEELAEEVDGSPWSMGEQNLIRIACSLAGCMPNIPSDWTLGTLLGGLDEENRRLVLAAIRYAMTAEA